MLKVGITSYVAGTKNNLNEAYTRAFFEKGVCPIILPQFNFGSRDISLIKDEERYSELSLEIAKSMDVLVVAGGGDINPLLFGETNKGSQWCDSLHDVSELYLIKQFLALNKPIMGICRGFQLLGNYFGMPNFKQHLNEEATKEFHNGKDLGIEIRDEPLHKIFLYGEFAKFFEAIKPNVNPEMPYRIKVNSWHHQGFGINDKSTPYKLENLMKALDEYEKDVPDIAILASTKSVIEAFEHTKYPVFGVQWHPEEYKNSLVIDYFLKHIVNKQEQKEN